MLEAKSFQEKRTSHISRRRRGKVAWPHSSSFLPPLLLSQVEANTCCCFCCWHYQVSMAHSACLSVQPSPVWIFFFPPLLSTPEQKRRRRCELAGEGGRQILRQNGLSCRTLQNPISIICWVFSKFRITGLLHLSFPCVYSLLMILNSAQEKFSALYCTSKD